MKRIVSKGKEGRRRKSIKVSINCIYDYASSPQYFTALSGRNADETLDKRLEKLGVENQRGRFLFEFGKRGRVELECIYKGRRRRRKFVTYANFEAINMLKNSLKRKGIEQKRGKLTFEFDKMDTLGTLSNDSDYVRICYPHLVDFVPCWWGT